MKQTVTIRTARLRKAIDAYFEIKHRFNNTHGGSIPRENWQEYENIKHEIANAAFNEGLSYEIVPGVIVLKKTMKRGKQQVSWIVSPSHHYTTDWVVKESLFS